MMPPTRVLIADQGLHEAPRQSEWLIPLVLGAHPDHLSECRLPRRRGIYR